MRKNLFALPLLAAVCGLTASTASATQIIYEPFDYTPAGTAIIGLTNTYSPGNPLWNRAGTAGASVHQILSGSLTGPSGFPASIGNAGNMLNADNTEYARMNLGQQYGPNSTLYYSLLLNVPATTGLTVPNSNVNANNDGIIAFNNNTGAGARPNVWSGELVIRLGSAASTFNLGVRASTTAAGTTYFSPDLTPGQTYLVVVRYTSGATAGTGGLNELWINPASATFGGSAPAADGSTAGSVNAVVAQDHVDSLIIGAGVAAGATPSNTYIDEIRVGTTWADVTAVPEPASLSVLALGAGALLARRRWE